MRTIPMSLALAACLAAPQAIAGQAASDSVPAPATQTSTPAPAANPRPRSVFGQVMAELTHSMRAPSPAPSAPTAPAARTSDPAATPGTAGTAPDPASGG